MATPNPNAKLRVLVCDSGKSDRKQVYLFDNDVYSATNFPAVNAIERRLGDKVEITRVDNIQETASEVLRHGKTHYALVVVESRHINDQEGGFKIKSISDYNPFLPMIIYGTDINNRNLAKGMRRGVRYYADNINLHEELRKIFYSPSPIRNLVVVKGGGSSFDFDRFGGDGQNLAYAAYKLAELKRRAPLIKGMPKQRIISTVGAGQHGEVSKDFERKHVADFKGDTELLRVGDLKANLAKLAGLMPENSFKVYESEDFYLINFDTLGKIAFMDIAPHWILSRDNIPLKDSDAHTIAIAELFGAKRVVLIKRADGIYDFDPNIGGFTKDYKRWRAAQNGNRRHSKVTVEDLLSGRISREGTDMHGIRDGSLGHLMEDSGLEYFAGCKNVEEILVVHIAPEEMYIPLGNNEFQHVVVPEDRIIVDPATGWRKILEDRIEQAFNGIAFSKIVRNLN